jgi:mannose-1-phosphate guanylyltransferase/mannose-6-phosphate isomerase
MKIIPVILSGGSGTRLWPLSRIQYPKQYLPLTSENTMLQETILRLNGIENIADPIIICNVEHRFLVAEQCIDIGITNQTILLEPIGRSTAPAIAAAACHLIKYKKDAILLVLSSDHLIQDIEKFHNAINIAKKQACLGNLATFGILPRDANTGYGYIKSSKELFDGASKVECFIEKPSLQMAKSFLEEGDYFWNSGMFMFSANVLIDELKGLSPEIYQAAKNAVDYASKDLDFIRLDEKSFALSPNNSIDYVVMEKSKNVVVVPLDAGWTDIGSWSSLYNIGEKDKNFNVIRGDVLTQDVNNCYINADHHLVVAIGVKNLIIVDTSNATLISSIDKIQEVREITLKLQDKNRQEQLTHRKVYRPWGWFDSIEKGANFQVKRLHVNPGAKLSLQKHHYRAEHWVVVSGTATTIKGKDKSILTKGESIYIPANTRHSLENNTKKPLEIIEVQSGNYLGEDDIVRFEDIYNRDNNEKK